MSDRPFLRVFVSSTYLDLIDERAALVKALLELRCIPQGMELFPSTTQDQWFTIQRAIDECDLYVLVVANRYGSICEEEGVSWTEREYHYARSQGKEICVLLHEEPDLIAARFSEMDSTRIDQLQRLRALLQETHLCAYWREEGDLKQALGTSVAALRERAPNLGLISVPTARSALLETDIVSALTEAGLAHVDIDFYRGIPWTDLFGTAAQVDVFMTYGRSWRRSLTRELRAFAARPETTLRVILPSTAERERTALPEIAKRAGQTVEEVIAKIDDADAELKSLGALIWRGDAAQLYASYRFDDVLVVTLYNHQRGQSEGVPTLVCERGGTLFEWFSRDFELMIANPLLTTSSS